MFSLFSSGCVTFLFLIYYSKSINQSINAPFVLINDNYTSPLLVMTSIWTNLRSRKTFTRNSSDSWWSSWTFNSLGNSKYQKVFISGYCLTYVSLYSVNVTNIWRHDSDLLSLYSNSCWPCWPWKTRRPKITLEMKQTGFNYCFFKLHIYHFFLNWNLINVYKYVELTFSPLIPTPCCPLGPLGPGRPRSPCGAK